MAVKAAARPLTRAVRLGVAPSPQLSSRRERRHWPPSRGPPLLSPQPLIECSVVENARAQEPVRWEVSGRMSAKVEAAGDGKGAQCSSIPGQGGAGSPEPERGGLEGGSRRQSPGWVGRLGEHQRKCSRLTEGRPSTAGGHPAAGPSGGCSGRRSGLALTPLLLGSLQPAERFGHSHETTGK